MAITKSSARKDTGSSKPRRCAEISIRKDKGPSSGGIGHSTIGPKEAWRQFHVVETKKIIRPFKRSLDIDELALINPYHPDDVLKDVHDSPQTTRADIRQFCILNRPKHEKPAKLFVSYRDYSYVIELKSMLNDTVLSFLVAYLSDKLSIDVKNGSSIRFVTHQAMFYINFNPETETDASFFMERKSTDGDPVIRKSRYAALFGDRNFSDWKRIFFPVYVNNIHFVGAVVDYGERRISTLDSLDALGTINYGHDSAYKKLASFLNLVLQYHEMDPVNWYHEKLVVPQQNDGISCGLFQTINGVIATLLYDDMKTAKELFLQSDDVVTARMRLAYLLITKGKLSHTPEEVKDFLQKEQARCEKVLLGSKDDRCNEYVDLLSSGSDDDDDDDDKQRESSREDSKKPADEGNNDNDDDDDDKQRRSSREDSKKPADEGNNNVEDSKSHNDRTNDEEGDGFNDDVDDDNNRGNRSDPTHPSIMSDQLAKCALGKACMHRRSLYSASSSFLISCTSCRKDVHPDSCTSQTNRGVCLVCDARRMKATSDRKRKASADDATLWGHVMSHKKIRAQPSRKIYAGGVIKDLSFRVKGTHFIVRSASKKEKETGTPSAELENEEMQCLPSGSEESKRSQGQILELDEDFKDLFPFLEGACVTLKKASQSVDRRDDGLLRMTSAVPLLSCLHVQCDRIELIDYARRNHSTSKIILRNAVPSDKEHDLLRVLEQQLESKDFDALVRTLENNNSGGNVKMVACVSLYVKQSHTPL